MASKAEFLEGTLNVLTFDELANLAASWGTQLDEANALLREVVVSLDPCELRNKICDHLARFETKL